MKHFRVEHGIVDFQMEFTTMLPSLPMPGTTYFSQLVKAFRPFGINPGSIVVNRRSNSLADTTLQVGLLNRTVNLRFGYGSFNLFASNPPIEEGSKIVPIIERAVVLIRAIDPDGDQGQASFRLGLHMTLMDDTVEDFLSRYINHPKSEMMKADALSFKLAFDEMSRGTDMKMVLTPSVAYPNALFTEITYSFKNKDDDESLALLTELEKHFRDPDELQGHFQMALGLFDLSGDLPADEGNNQ